MNLLRLTYSNMRINCYCSIQKIVYVNLVVYEKYQYLFTQSGNNSVLENRTKPFVPDVQLYLLMNPHSCRKITILRQNRTVCAELWQDWILRHDVKPIKPFILGVF